MQPHRNWKGQVIAAHTLAIALLTIGTGVNSSWAGAQLNPNPTIIPEPTPSPSPSSPPDPNDGSPKGQGQNIGEPDPDLTPSAPMDPQPEHDRPVKPDKDGSLLYPLGTYISSGEAVKPAQLRSRPVEPALMMISQAEEPPTQSQPSTEPTTPTPAPPPDTEGQMTRGKNQQDMQPRIFEQNEDVKSSRDSQGKNGSPTAPPTPQP
jgi:hypothetical protein